MWCGGWRSPSCVRALQLALLVLMGEGAGVEGGSWGLQSGMQPSLSCARSSTSSSQQPPPHLVRPPSPPSGSSSPLTSPKESSFGTYIPKFWGVDCVPPSADPNYPSPSLDPLPAIHHSTSLPRPRLTPIPPQVHSVLTLEPLPAVFCRPRCPFSTAPRPEQSPLTFSRMLLQDAPGSCLDNALLLPHPGTGSAFSQPQRWQH